MASCTRVDNLLQAYLDGELPSSERVILEGHVAGCPKCKALLRRHRRTSAMLFEALAPARLGRDLADSAMAHLPEMEHPTIDVAGVNLRVKHPAMFWERAVRLLPIAVAVLLLFLAAVINKNWPAAEIPEDALGLVSHSRGGVYRIEKGSTVRSTADVNTIASRGDRYETERDSALMLMLLGPTELWAAGDTRVLIHDDRKISVEKGHVFLDVAKGRRLFKVLTPSGDITVFGTKFDVLVESDQTTVVVQDGEVQLGHIEEAGVFSIVRPGQLASVVRGEGVIRPREVNVSDRIAWTRAIVPDKEALQLFTAEIAPLQETTEVAGRRGYIVETRGKPLKSILLEWEPTSPFLSYTDYELFVYTHDNEALFRSRISSSVFSDPDVTTYEIENTGDRKQKLRHIFVRLVPDDAENKQEVEVKKLDAVIWN